VKLFETTDMHTITALQEMFGLAIYRVFGLRVVLGDLLRNLVNILYLVKDFFSNYLSFAATMLILK